MFSVFDIFFQLVNYISLFSFTSSSVSVHFLFSSFSFSFNLTQGYFSVIFQFQFQLTDETLRGICCRKVSICLS